MARYFRICFGARLFWFYVFLCFASYVSAQTYNMGNLGTINNVCSGNFYDSQGSAGQYQNNENFTATFCAPAGQYLIFNFSSFNTELGLDILTIYSGPNTASPLIGSFSGNGNSPGVISSTLGGCITFVFVSDGSVRRAGWAATISCSATPPNNGGDVCNGANPFCTSSSYTFPNNTNITGLGAINCLASTPNPVWYYFQIQNSGNLIINISQVDAFGVPIDVDFNLWGPFTSLADGCLQIQAGTAPNVDCSYSPAAAEQAIINGALVGQVYIMLLTNFANQPGTITFGADPSSTATTNCNILCNISGLTAVPAVCNAANGQYSVSGQVTFTNPPSSGTLVISSSCGGSVTIPGPWTSPVNYTIPGITANGAVCSVTASFSADATCIAVQPYTSPPACGAACSITSIIRLPGACVPLTNTYTLTGQVVFSNPPAFGTLTITSSCGGTQIFNAPFTSPINYSIPSIPANGSACTVTATFSAIPSCTLAGGYTAPVTCNTGPCGTNAGTTTVSYTGSSIIPNVICAGGSIDIVSNNNYTLPAPGDLLFEGPSELVYLIYVNGGPTVSNPALDPNYSGFLWPTTAFTTVNAGGWNINSGGSQSSLAQVIPSVNNTWCFVPFTADNSTNYLDINADGCYSLGTPVCFQFLNPINLAQTPSCTGLQTFTVTGGYPEFYGGNYTITNTGAGTLSPTTVSSGGTFTISGLTYGQTYSFTITDAGGCSRNFSAVLNNILDVSLSTPNSQICQGNCTSLSATVPNVTGNLTFSNNTPFAIYDAGIPDSPPAANNAGPATVAGTWTVSPITVNNICPATWSTGNFIEVKLNITHTWDADLNIFLRSPAGVFIKLSDDNGGSGDNYINTVFSSAGVTNITLGAAPFTATYLPEPGSFAGLNGQAINGIWRLYVADDVGGDVGTLQNWSITFFNNPVVSYSWSPAAGLSAANIANPGACPTTTTNYVLTVSNNCGCSDIASKLIEVEPPNSAVISYPGTPFCTSETIPQPVLQTGSPGGTYSSSPAGLSLNTTNGEVNPSLSLPGTYTVTYTIPAGICPGFSTITTMSIISSPSAGGNGSITLCSNAAPVSLFASLTGSPNTGGVWSPAILGGGYLGTFNPAVNPAGVYTYTVSTCGTASANVTVNLNNPITPTFTTPGPYCAGDVIPALPVTSGNGISGTWSPAINSTTTTTYTFTPTAGQCASPATVTINIQPIPALSPIFHD